MVYNTATMLSGVPTNFMYKRVGSGDLQLHTCEAAAHAAHNGLTKEEIKAKCADHLGQINVTDVHPVLTQPSGESNSLGAVVVYEKNHKATDYTVYRFSLSQDGSVKQELFSDKQQHLNLYPIQGIYAPLLIGLGFVAVCCTLVHLVKYCPCYKPINIV